MSDMDARLTAPGPPFFCWAMVTRSLTRPYRLTLPMVALMALVPGYLVIANVTQHRAVYAPAMPLDDMFSLQPIWALIYGPLYLFLILLPLFVVHQPDHIRRTFASYLTVWIGAYAIFVLYPTTAPRPAEVLGDGFAVWGLRFLYDADPPYNCFPSIHVAHSFVSASSCYRIHRRLGWVALIGAALVALSTLFTKQHYVADVIGGMCFAGLAYAAFLRGYSRDRISEAERQVAPMLALVTSAVVVAGSACVWLVYLFELVP